MTVSTASIALSTTPAALRPTGYIRARYTLLFTPAADTYVGTSAVTSTAYGVKVLSGTTLTLTIEANEKPYAVLASSTATSKAYYSTKV